ncbi:MAG: alpha/beta fold hydrolase, partial [Ktedonobacteraceae bacterium]
PELPGNVDLADFQRELRANLPHAVVNTGAFARVLDQYVDPWNSHLGKEVLYQHVRLLVPYYSNAVSSDLKVLGKPALIIWGEKDQQNPEKYAARLQREIPDAQLVLVPNAGHLVLFDAPDNVASALNTFVNKL